VGTVRWLLAAFVVLLAAAFLWRPLSAWWCDDQGNLALVRGDLAGAGTWFARGLALEPSWHTLLEDRGRTVLDSDPAAALADFREAACGEPCIAEAGDAEIRLGRVQDALDDYLAAHAVERVAGAVASLSQSGRYDGAIALERALIVKLGSGMLAQADLATAYDTIGSLDALASQHRAQGRRAYEADAIRCYRRASDLAPFNEGYLLSLGFSELQWGSKSRARAAFERVLDLHPHEADAERGLAQLGVVDR